MTNDTTVSKTREEVLEEACTVLGEEDSSTEEQQQRNKAAARRGLSVVSKQYDRGNKGYLDSDEMALRKMDSQNQGHLDINKTLRMFQELKESQKQNVTYRKIILALGIFSVLLAISNIGTSFAAATLAKDSKVQAGQLVDKTTGERLATTPKTIVVNLDEEEEMEGGGRRRKLETTSVTTISKTTAWQHWGVKLCTNLPFRFYNLDPTTFSCDTGVDNLAIQHCGYYTHIFAQGTPQFKTDSAGDTYIIWYFDAFRSRLLIGTVALKCSLDKTIGTCEIGDVDTKTNTQFYCSHPCYDFLCDSHWWCQDNTVCDYSSPGVCNQCVAVTTDAPSMAPTTL